MVPTQLEVRWAYSSHLVYLQLGTVDGLHAIQSGLSIGILILQ